MKLVKEMVDHHYELDPHYKPWNKYKDLKKYVIGWLKERGTKTLVAEEGGEIIGYARVLWKNRFISCFAEYRHYL